jgi:iron complex transport system substrate-binding protein
MDDAKSGIVVLLIGLIYGSTIAFYHHLSFDENSEFFSALINAARRSLSVISMESSSTECLCAILNTPDPYFPEIITDLAKIIKGVSEFCDYPTEVKSIKEVTMSMITGSTSQETEEQMENLEKKGIRELHINDDAFIKKMRPGIILTQDSYGRCGASDSFIHSTLDKAGLSQSCTLSTRPLSVQDMLDSILTLGQAIGEIRRSQSLHASLCQRLINVDVTVSRSALPRVLGLESLFPLVASGQWLPDMRKRAGGIDVLEGLNFYGMQGEKIVYRSGCAPVRLLWGDVVKADPEAIVISCCGMKASQSINEVMLHMVSQEGFWDLRALQSNPSGLYIVDHDVFSRPGPRVVNGIEILAALLHPHLIPKIDIDKTVTVLRYCGERFLPVSEFPNNFKQIWTLEGQGTSGSTYYKLPELKTSVNEDVANSIENITGPLHDISKPYTLEELRNESDSMIIETLAEIDEIDDDSKGNELYMFLHKIAVFFGYQQYVDPSSGYTVFTSFFLKGRPCCGNKCRHCPWAHVNVKKTKVADW